LSKIFTAQKCLKKLPLVHYLDAYNCGVSLFLEFLKNSFPFRARFVAMKSKDVAAQRKSINLHRRSRSLSLTAVENQKTLFIPSPAQRVFPYPPLFAARLHHIPSFRIQSNPLHPAARIPAERLMQKSHSQSARNNFRSAADGKMKLSRCKQPWLVGNLGP
jgi:hypothetical protein